MSGDILGYPSEKEKVDITGGGAVYQRYCRKFKTLQSGTHNKSLYLNQPSLSRGSETLRKNEEKTSIAI